MFTLYRRIGSEQTFKFTALNLILAALKAFPKLHAYQSAVQSYGLAICMPVHQSSDCSMPSARKLTAIFYLRIFAQRHRENPGKSCTINKKNNCFYLRH